LLKILIAGASRGIGRYLAERLINDDYPVYGTYNKTKPDNTGNIRYYKVDTTVSDAVREWIKQINFGQNDKTVLINCVGSNYNAMLHKAEDSEWRNAFDTNIMSAYYLSKYIVPIMRENDFGRIIFFSSVVPKIGVPGTSAYSAAKAALWGLSKTIAIENARKDITANTINLGYFDIGMISDVPEDMLEQIKVQIPKAKLGDPENIYNAVRFLMNSDYITGSQIDMNGGLA
jgi:acetoacetyl-CoA reductase/3-oxoacyl-[acyl-carrier protein] reductase